ncbi:MAG: AAA family ATPase [Desulfobacteraceae bacterium]|nr:AAA family ATPase [Desulfobacteraceae bacterium]
MYRNFYHIKAKPFQTSADPKFMWAGEKHQEALATLKYGIINNKGFVLLTGDVGTGKTTLINTLLQSLKNNNGIICASVPDCNLDFIDFINYVAYSFGMEEDFKTKGSFLISFKKFLMNAAKNGKKVLLIIDEAQLLTDEMLEQIRLLSNIDRAESKILNIFFVGQNEFNDILLKKSNRAVRQRLSLNYNLHPLTTFETYDYIKHRLKVAGTSRELFTNSAVQKIHQHAEGAPRRINILCDHCLLSGYVNKQKKIDESIVQECAAELDIPSGMTSSDSETLEVDTLEHKETESTTIQIPSPDEKAAFNILKKISIKLKTLLIAMPAFALCILLIMLIFLYHNADKQQLAITTPVQSPLEDQNKTNIALTENNENSKVDDKKSTETKPAPPPFETKTIIIRFNHNTNDFNKDGLILINEYAEFLQNYPDAKMEITGYTDSRGAPLYNINLSKLRANIVKSFLLGKGIKPEQIIVRGLGNENPVESNDTPIGRQMNRRVEITAYQNDQ